jgi:hypothetical protein
MAGIFDFLFGSEDKFNKLDTMAPEQKQLFQQFIGLLGGQGGQPGGGQMGMEHLMQLLNPSSEAYKKFEQPYMQQFEQQTIPGLAERFAGMGGGLGGGMSSSGFGQALGAAGGNLQAQLAQMKTGMQSQAANSLLQHLQQALGQQSFAYGHQPASPGMIPIMAGKFAEGFGKSFGAGF